MILARVDNAGTHLPPSPFPRQAVVEASHALALLFGVEDGPANFVAKIGNGNIKSAVQPNDEHVGVIGRLHDLQDDVGNEQHDRRFSEPGVPVGLHDAELEWHGEVNEGGFQPVHDHFALAPPRHGNYIRAEQEKGGVTGHWVSPSVGVPYAA